MQYLQSQLRLRAPETLKLQLVFGAQGTPRWAVQPAGLWPGACELDWTATDEAAVVLQQLREKQSSAQRALRELQARSLVPPLHLCVHCSRASLHQEEAVTVTLSVEEPGASGSEGVVRVRLSVGLAPSALLGMELSRVTGSASTAVRLAHLFCQRVHSARRHRRTLASRCLKSLY